MRDFIERVREAYNYQSAWEREPLFFKTFVCSSSRRWNPKTNLLCSCRSHYSYMDCPIYYLFHEEK